MSAPRPAIDSRVEAALPRALVEARRRITVALRDPGFLEGCMARYRDGQAEYGHAYEWLDWDAGDFRAEVVQEIADVVIYTAMELANRQIVGAPRDRSSEVAGT
jgi:hypothetical protein